MKIQEDRHDHSSGNVSRVFLAVSRVRGDESYAIQFNMTPRCQGIGNLLNCFVRFGIGPH